MDMKMIGSFLSDLRKERGLTQEQLGDILGTTNKTISRWETGVYMPPVEMLQQLSDLYGITINEILSGQKLEETQYRQKAEENIKVVLKTGSFTLGERIVFYKRKWRRDHLFSGVVIYGILTAAFLAGTVFDYGIQIPALLGVIGATVLRNNQMMIYVENRAFDGTGMQ